MVVHDGFPETRNELVDAIAQTARDIDALHRDIGAGTPNDDQQAWWDGLLARFRDYTNRLALVDERLAERLSRLPDVPGD
jgi:hypothetical protein